MSHEAPHDRSDDRPPSRRSVLAGGVGIGIAALAGCTEITEQLDADEETGTFRLLISDQPVAIDDFDHLNVTFESARLFRGDDVDDDVDEDENDPNGNGDDDLEDDVDDDANEDEPDDDADDDAIENETEDDQEDDVEGSPANGFISIDLDGATVDLTEVVGDVAMPVFEDDLPSGEYSKIELFAQEVDGVVDDEQADVKIPSEKLQIVKPFEIASEETTSFVFDINVVKRGQAGGYNLLPVIAKSGVVGEDVEVEEVEPGSGNRNRSHRNDGRESTGGSDDSDESDGDDSATDDTPGGPPDDDQPGEERGR